MIHQTYTAFFYLPVNFLEIPRIPGIFYVKSLVLVGIFSQKMHLALGVPVKHAAQDSHVLFVHPDYQVKPVIFRARDQCCLLAFTGDPVTRKDLLHGRIYGAPVSVPDLVSMGRSGLTINEIGQAFGIGQVFQYELGNRRSADIAVTYKQYFYHSYDLP